MTEKFAATVEMASVDKEAIRKLHSLSECCICLTTFTDPRMLPCFHTACLKCFEDIQLKNGKKPGDVLPCPLCRNEFPIPPDGMKGLQKNFFIERLIEVTSSFNLEEKSRPCMLCNIVDEGKGVAEATMSCLNCRENYCLRCSKIHKILQGTKDHKIVEINIELNEEEIRNMFPIRKCVTHSDKVLDYYCSDCMSVVCVSCFVEDHQMHKCKDVKTVDKEFRRRIEQTFKVIDSHKEGILSRKSELEGQKREFLAKALETEDVIKKKNQQLKVLIDQHTKDVLNELVLLKQKHEKKMETEIEENERKLAVLESFVTYCSELKSKGSPSEVCGNVDRLLTRAKDLSKENDEYLKTPCKPFHLEFIDTEYNALLQNARNLIGKLSVAKSLITKEDVTFKDIRMLVSSPTTGVCKSWDNQQPSSKVFDEEMECSVEVSNIPSDMSEETLMLFFESKRFGRDDVENITFNKERRAAVVTFKDHAVALNMLSKHSLNFNGNKLKITRPSDGNKVEIDLLHSKDTCVREDEVNGGESLLYERNRAVIISNIFPSVSEEALWMIFESKRYGGGKIERLEYNKKDGTACIEFEDPNVTTSILNRGSMKFKDMQILLSECREKHGRHSIACASQLLRPSSVQRGGGGRWPRAPTWGARRN